MQPVRTAVLVTAADAGCRRRRISKQEISKRVPGELTGIGEGAACIVRLLGPKLQMEVVRAKFDPVYAAVHRDVVVEFDVLVVPKDKRGWITHRAVQATHGDLGE